MEIQITGKHIELGETFTAHIQETLSNTINKYFGKSLEASVIVTKDKGHFRTVDITVHIGKDISAKSHGQSHEVHEAYEMALAKLQKRLGRYKNRLRDHHSNNAKEVQTFKANYYVMEHVETEEEQGEHSLIVAEMVTEIPLLTVSEAVMRMDLGDLSALMFKNANNGQFNVVYRRTDGNVGWIDPSNLVDMI